MGKMTLFRNLMCDPNKEVNLACCEACLWGELLFWFRPWPNSVQSKKETKKSIFLHSFFLFVILKCLVFNDLGQKGSPRKLNTESWILKKNKI